MLALDPQRRTSASDALKNPWFTTEKPAPTPLGDMPQVKKVRTARAGDGLGILVFHRRKSGL